MTDGTAPVQDAAPPAPAPNIQADPTSVTLPGVAGMPSEPQTITLSNTGDAPLNITSVTIEPEAEAAHFGLTGPEAYPAQVAVGESVDLAVTYTAPDPREHSATLVIESDDPDAPRLTVPLVGRIFEACIRAMPSAVDLGAVDAGIRSGRFEVRIINCGDVPRTIASITTTGDENFSWSTRNDADPTGRILERGDSLSINITYNNVSLAPDDTTTGRLNIAFTEEGADPVSIGLTARGGAGMRCLIEMEPTSLDFEILRLGLVRAIETRIINRGTGPCELREIVVAQTAGEEGNPFTITQNVELNTLQPMTSRTLEISYSPTIANPVGERGVLTVAYHDALQNMNRSEEVLLRGTGAEALIGSIPAVIDFDETTATNCASRQLRIGAENVGFVPLCALSYELEGPDCDRFFLTETPEFGECLSLERGEAASFLAQFEPNRTGRANCNIMVSSDAQNLQTVALPLTGRGTETDGRTDTHEVGELNPRRNAHWALRLPAVEASVRVYVDDMRTNDFAFDEDRNRIAIEPDHHPAEGAELRIEYNAVCYDRRGD